MPKSRVTRSKDSIWLIGHPSETITGARLPAGRDVMQNFIFFHCVKKLPVADSARQVHDQLMPFWTKSRLPVRQKQHIIQKIKDLYSEQQRLMSSRARSNEKDKQNQKQYTEKLDNLFDISHANAAQLISNEEDRLFLKLQQESRTGCIGPVDRKLLGREKRSAKRQEQFAKQVASAAAAATSSQEMDCAALLDSENSLSEDDNDDFVVTTPSRSGTAKKIKRQDVLSPKVAAVLDRTNLSIRTSTMILASMVNEVGCSTSSAVLSKSTVHRKRQHLRCEAAQQIKNDFIPCKSVVHWDGKLMSDLTGDDTNQVDRLPILISSLVDGSIKLLGVPKLTSGSGQTAADAVYELLVSWKCENLIIGMCFDTTASNTGKHKGACTLLEVAVGHNLLWLACRHHMLEVLLSDAFGVCFGPSTGPDILIFKRFRDKWSAIHHIPIDRQAPLINDHDDLKTFIERQLNLESHPRHDYFELLCLAGAMLGMQTNTTIRKPGALHRARWMAKAIYSLKMELLFDGNEDVLKLTAQELQGIQRFNRFVVCVYLQSWFTSRIAIDAPINDILLIQRLNEYDDVALQTIGLKMMKRHSWYLGQEMATLALFSERLSPLEKAHHVLKMKTVRGERLLTSLPSSLSELSMSRSFFQTAGIDDSFLEVDVETWPNVASFKIAKSVVKKLVCVNDCAERGVALIQTFNESVTKNEEQKQYLLQVVEKHRNDFKHCRRDNLVDM